jgi:hypothetical protein
MRLLYFSLAMLACFALNGLSPRFAAAEVIIQFDYSLDTQGFFNDPVRRERLEQAAALWRFTDALAPILPDDGNAWSIRLQHPGEPSFPTRNNLSVPANTVLIYPGGRPLVGALGFANAATLLSRSGSPEFLAAVDNRGQTGATQTPPVDFGPTVGTITFSSSAPWHFGATTEGLDSTKQDFLTTAVHEIGHLLGIGESASWDALMRSTPGGLVFDGAASTAAHGGPVPVDPFGSHPASGLSSFVGGVPQTLLMDPSTPRGVREVPTVLDIAMLRDVGWTPVPEPSGFVIAGATVFVVIGTRTWKRHRGQFVGQVKRGKILACRWN